MMGSSMDCKIKAFTYKVTAHTWKTEVLVFEADQLESIFKSQFDKKSPQEIVASYNLKLPTKSDRNPTFE